MHPKSSTPRVIKSNEDFVVFKLVSGEILLAIRTVEDKDNLAVEFPFLLKNYPRISAKTGAIIEQVTAGPFCSFAENRVFSFAQKDIMFCKRLHNFAIPFYMSLYNEHERLVEMGMYDDFETRFLNPSKSARMNTQESINEFENNFDDPLDNEQELSREEVEEFKDFYNALKTGSKKTIH